VPLILSHLNGLKILTNFHFRTLFYFNAINLDKNPGKPKFRCPYSKTNFFNFLTIKAHKRPDLFMVWIDQ
jgi:hypothetical protein